MAKKLTVEKFLCCISLELGGLIIAWWHLIQFTLGSIGSVVLIIIGSTCKNKNKIGRNKTGDECHGGRAIRFFGETLCVDHKDHKTNEKAIIEDEEETCTAIIVVFATLLVFCLIGVFISWLCIKGIQTREKSYVKPMVIMLGIFAVLTLPSILWWKVAALVNAAIGGYYCLIMYSLYIRFQKERERGSASVKYDA